MKHSEFKLITSDGVNLYGQRWEPGGNPVGIVCLVHGLGEHSGRYEHLAQFLTDNGYALQGFDLRGHGRSDGKRGDIPGYEALLDDIDLSLANAKRHWPGLPVFLYGHSLGGNLVLNYALRRKPELAGVISTSPWLELAAKVPAWKLAAGRLLNRLWPSLTLSNGLNTKALCRDAEVVRLYEQDPLVHDQISARMTFALMEAADWALEHAAGLDLPLLLMHGSADRITSAAGSARFARAAGDKVHFKEWQGGYHEVHNDPPLQQQYFTYLLDWMETVRLKEKAVSPEAPV